jgi:hypothetical protein
MSLVYQGTWTSSRARQLAGTNINSIQSEEEGEAEEEGVKLRMFKKLKQTFRC